MQGCQEYDGDWQIQVRRVAILDDSAAMMDTTIYMLKCIEDGSSDVKVVLST